MKKVINLTPHVVNVYDLSNNPVCDIPVMIFESMFGEMLKL